MKVDVHTHIPTYRDEVPNQEVRSNPLIGCGAGLTGSLPEYAADMSVVDRAIVFGPGDLSVKMGFHGEWEHPEVLAAIESVVQGARARELAVEPPVMPTDRAAYERELERGVRMFGAMRRSEYDLLKEAADKVMAVYL
jgi:2-keto-3-deoxy-L-rhamnonate aldolase RhmA